MQALKTQDKRLIFMGMKGVTIVDPDHLTMDFVPPPVVIERVIIDRKSIDTQHVHRVLPGKGELEVH